MIRAIFTTLGLSLLPLLTVAQIPEGFSAWSHSGPCDADCRSIRRKPTKISVWLVRRGGLVCGGVVQNYGLEAWNKSPSGRFAGRVVGERVELSFTDSFSEEVGEVFGSVAHGELRFEVRREAEGGYLSLSKAPLQRRAQAGLPRNDAAYKACIAFKGDVGQYLAER
jgi:hypothetical protein